MSLFRRKRVPTSRIYPLQFRKIWKKLLTLEMGVGKEAHRMWRSIFGTLFIVAAIFALIVASTPQQVAPNYLVLLIPFAAVFFGMLFLIIIYQWLYIWTYFYDLDDHFLRVRKGVLIRREVSVPYNRIHDVYFDQDPLDHILNLYDLYVATASEISHTETHIDGLSRQNGEAVRNLLLEKVEKSRGAASNTPNSRLDS